MPHDIKRRGFSKGVLIAGIAPIGGCAASGDVIEGSANTTTTTDDYAFGNTNDLVIENSSGEPAQLELRVQSTSGTGSLEENVTLGTGSKDNSVKVYEDIAAMDSECSILVDKVNGARRKYIFEGDAVDGSKGVAVTIYENRIQFREVTV